MNKKSTNTANTVYDRIRSIKFILSLIHSKMIEESPDDAFHRDMGRALDSVIALCGATADAVDTEKEVAV